MPDQAASSLFGSDQTQSPAANTSATSAADSSKDPLTILVGEGRKYKSPEDLAKAYLEADGFIEKLKGENATLREGVAKSKTIEDVLQRIQQGNASTQDQGADKAPQGLSADAVAKIVRETVTGLETARTRQENLTKAEAEMRKLYGDKANDVFKARAANPQVKAALQALAEVSPDQFIQLFKPQGDQATGSQTDSGTQVNTAALETTTQSGRVQDPNCKEFYDAIRKKEPRTYYSAATQLQMHKVALANPDKFFGKKVGS